MTSSVLAEKPGKCFLEEILGNVGIASGTPQEAVDAVVVLFVGVDELGVARASDHLDHGRFQILGRDRGGVTVHDPVDVRGGALFRVSAFRGQAA